ncbi:MAG: dockerin type I domain-containing protein [Ruminococcus sp.]
MDLKKPAAGLTAVICMMLPLHAKAEASDILLVPVADGIPLSDKTGQIYIHIQNQDALCVVVEKTEPEGIFCYYDTILNGKDGQDETIYRMDLSRCEYLVDTEQYASQYAISISSEIDADASYTQTFSVQDPDFEDVTGCEYHFYVSLEACDTSGFQLLSSSETIEDGMLIGKQILVLQYQAYTLGDVDQDGTISLSDASEVLEYYARKSAGIEAEILLEAADIDKNQTVDLADASYILTYYAQASAGMNPDWDDLLP